MEHAAQCSAHASRAGYIVDIYSLTESITAFRNKKSRMFRPRKITLAALGLLWTFSMSEWRCAHKITGAERNTQNL